jgi:hypothetical protein
MARLWYTHSVYEISVVSNTAIVISYNKTWWLLHEVENVMFLEKINHNLRDQIDYYAESLNSATLAYRIFCIMSGKEYNQKYVAPNGLEQQYVSKT